MDILLVEDDVTTVDSIEICLYAFKPEWKIMKIGNGLDVVQTITSNTFDAIVMDLGLPGLDGILVLKELSNFCNVPIIIISARNNENEINLALKLGVKDYICKPFEYKRLLSSLTEHCEGALMNMENIN
jgi:DNA-binding response OmpR family regulator